jgi:hypothetical protein
MEAEVNLEDINRAVELAKESLAYRSLAARSVNTTVSYAAVDVIAAALVDLHAQHAALLAVAKAAREWHRYYGESEPGDATAFAEAEDGLFWAVDALEGTRRV